jgi:hypothetical protein
LDLGVTVGRVMAHYRTTDFVHLYQRTTIGQLLLLDENALSYVKLTNPMGSGEETDVKPKAKTGTATTNDLERIASTKLKGKVQIVKSKLEDMPPEYKAMMLDMERN